MNARFAAGDRVRVREWYPPGHVRTPYYVRGKRGQIERICGTFNNPEHLAYNRPDDPRVLYRVRFTQTEVWGRAEHPSDTIDIEIYEHWLEPET
ncbi:MAG TPA: SH3-like domain-containing protein [Candidatus Acidoferrales bacterium]|nr:SH3-like domain-containing protein [Candidatus Acidoferrales bacterium]